MFESFKDHTKLFYKSATSMGSIILRIVCIGYFYLYVVIIFY